jgi:nucleoside-diphosphate-sugar epimerase
MTYLLLLALGFIGRHLVKKLREEGFERFPALDQKSISEWYQVFDYVEIHAFAV